MMTPRAPSLLTRAARQGGGAVTARPVHMLGTCWPPASPPHTDPGTGRSPMTKVPAPRVGHTPRRPGVRPAARTPERGEADPGGRTPIRRPEPDRVAGVMRITSVAPFQLVLAGQRHT